MGKESCRTCCQLGLVGFIFVVFFGDLLLGFLIVDGVCAGFEDC